MDYATPLFQNLADDLNDFRQWRMPQHIEVCLRVCTSTFLSLVLSLGDFPNVVPPSQRAMVAMIPGILSLLFPTLMFSVGAVIFPIQVVLIVMGLVFATLLLACATVNRAFYSIMFGVVAFIVSGTRFNKSTGALTTLLMMNVALNSVSQAESAEEYGLDFVKSLWAETGLTNSKAYFVNSLVGFLWICGLITVSRILPPFRTARQAISKLVLPGCLDTMVSIVKLSESVWGDENNNAKQRSFESIEQEHTALVRSLLNTKAILDDGGVATKTAFEPRLFRFGPPECSWKVLQNLAQAVDRMALATLAIQEVWRDPRINVKDIQLERILPLHNEAATIISSYATALRNGTPVPEERAVEQSLASKPTKSVDIVFFSSMSGRLTAAINDWMKVVGPPDRTRSYFDATAREALKLNLMPWIFASGIGFLLAIIKNFCIILKPDFWKRMLHKTHKDFEFEKAVWCVKFAIGFSALAAMSVYWKAFAELEVQVYDDGELPAKAHFSGWTLIAYAMSTTQTTEGTVKKGILRLLGTAAGGFSGWLALTACGDNIYGLTAWITVLTFIASYIGLGRGNKAYLGASQDYGYAPCVFIMTQSLVVVDVYVQEGFPKNDITLNRILANCAGIATAMLLAILPPNLYGNNPKLAISILEEEKLVLKRSLRFILDYLKHPSSDRTQSTDDDPFKELTELNDASKGKVSNLLSEANDFYSDSAKLVAFPLYKSDPKLKDSLVSLKVMQSWNYTIITYAMNVFKDERFRKSFLVDTKSQARLEEVLQMLEAEIMMDLPVVADEECPESFESRVFVHFIHKSYRKLRVNQERLSTIQWGIVSSPKDVPETEVSEAPLPVDPTARSNKVDFSKELSC